MLAAAAAAAAAVDAGMMRFAVADARRCRRNVYRRRSEAVVAATARVACMLATAAIAVLWILKLLLPLGRSAISFIIIIITIHSFIFLLSK